AGVGVGGRRGGGAESGRDVGGRVDDLGELDAETTLTPLPETAPYVVGVDLEGLADVLEGEEPGAVHRQHPLPRLLEHLPPPRVAGVRVLLVAVDGILEHREHEEPLAFETTRPPECREVLCGEKNVAFEQSSQPTVPA